MYSDMLTQSNATSFPLAANCSQSVLRVTNAQAESKAEACHRRAFEIKMFFKSLFFLDDVEYCTFSRFALGSLTII